MVEEDEMSEWKTIETAPKDKPIWAYNGEQGVMKYLEIKDGDCEYSGFIWVEQLLQDADPDPNQPTHWMPLPDPPKGEMK